MSTCSSRRSRRLPRLSLPWTTALRVKSVAVLRTHPTSDSFQGGRNDPTTEQLVESAFFELCAPTTQLAKKKSPGSTPTQSQGVESALSCMAINHCLMCEEEAKNISNGSFYIERERMTSPRIWMPSFARCSTSQGATVVPLGERASQVDGRVTIFQ